MSEAAELAEQSAWALGPQGALASHDPGYRPRSAQDAMARAVARALQAREALVVEAGTGVGKTFAYLVPLLLSGRRALVSTATKSLQDQLFLRDLPRLKSALGVPARLALLKGRSSYLCLHRLEQARQSAELPDRWAVRALARVESWAPTTRTGDLAEIDGLDDRSPVIPLVTSTRDNCLGTECPSFAACHVVRARREAMAADVVVVNHHLFFADLVLRDSGVAELLPSVEAAVFDEAHQLVDAGLQFLGTQLGVGQVIELTRDVLAAGLQKARGLQPWAERCAALETAARDLRLVCAGPLGQVRGLLKLRWEERARGDGFGAALGLMGDAAGRLSEALQAVEGLGPDFHRLQERADAVRSLCSRFVADPAPGRVRWIDLSPNSARLVESPLDIRDMLGEQRRAAEKAWIFTSATLGDDESLSWFTQGTGLEDATLLRVGSPFDYPSQARLWVPRRFPKPNDSQHAQAVGALAARCAAALGGRSFVLTTTLRVLPVIAEALRESLARIRPDIQILVQGSQPRRSLMQQFGDGRARVLVGSASFWEGIDVPGDALQCVLIDKLPFPPPSDPLVEARVRQIEARGGNAFQEHFVSEAAIALKQGGGRLIRTETDRGLLVVCDPRLVQMPYGGRLRAALPPMQPLAQEAEALAWLEELAAAHKA
jgi:ATP-dependent DNA helicase DinG